jgi:hypothetical protein
MWHKMWHKSKLGVLRGVLYGVVGLVIDFPFGGYPIDSKQRRRIALSIIRRHMRHVPGLLMLEYLHGHTCFRRVTWGAFDKAWFRT